CESSHPYRPGRSVDEVALDAEDRRQGILIREGEDGAAGVGLNCGIKSGRLPVECRVVVPPYQVETDVEVRYRVPHSSGAHFRDGPIGAAAASRNSNVATIHIRTDRLRCGVVISHADHAAIERCSPYAWNPIMFIGGVE